MRIGRRRQRTHTQSSAPLEDARHGGQVARVVDPEVTSLSNIAYLSALRLEEAVPETSSLALLAFGGLLVARRRHN